MTTRLQCCLRVLLAVVTFGCAAISVSAETAAAMPDLAIVAASIERSAAQEAPRVVARPIRARIAARAPRPAAVRCSRPQPQAPSLARSPRLYLRHCVLLR